MLGQVRIDSCDNSAIVLEEAHGCIASSAENASHLTAFVTMVDVEASSTSGRRCLADSAHTPLRLKRDVEPSVGHTVKRLALNLSMAVRVIFSVALCIFSTLRQPLLKVFFFVYRASFCGVRGLAGAAGVLKAVDVSGVRLKLIYRSNFLARAATLKPFRKYFLSFPWASIPSLSVTHTIGAGTLSTVCIKSTRLSAVFAESVRCLGLFAGGTPFVDVHDSSYAI